MKIDKDRLIEYLESVVVEYDADYQKGMYEIIEYIKYYSEEEALL